MRKVQERAAECVGVLLQFARHRFAYRPRGFGKVGMMLAVTEPSRHATDRRVNRHHRMVRGEQQHPVGAGLAHLRQAFERSARRRQRTANYLRQFRRASESVDACSERAQSLLRVGTGKRDAVLELLLRRPRHRVGGERPDSPERAEGRIALSRRGVDRQYFPDEQTKRIVRRRMKRSVKPLQRVDERVESGHRLPLAVHHAGNWKKAAVAASVQAGTATFAISSYSTADAMIPLWKLPRSSFSLGACAFSSGSPTPNSTDGKPSSS